MNVAVDLIRVGLGSNISRLGGTHLRRANGVLHPTEQSIREILSG